MNKLMLTKRKKIVSVVLIVAILAVLFFVIFFSNAVWIKPFSTNGEIKYGVIDERLNEKHSNIEISNEKQCATPAEKSHGDYVLDFIKEISPSTSVYYYNAEENGKITTESIILGLNWMLENEVDCVTLSLSGKVYSEELESWIAQNSDNITVYASYNNARNTFDYPANYSNVIGVGTTQTINKKDNDVIYKTSDIRVASFPFKKYVGNSYLAPYTMLNNHKK